MKKFVLVFIALLIVGCSSIPVSTMLKYRNFDEQSFAALDPLQVRSKIRLSKPFTLKIEKINLSLSIENENGLRDFTYPLVLLKQDKIAAQEGFFSSKPAGTEYTLRLSDLAVKNFRETQKLISHSQGEASFSINASFNEEPQEGQTVFISIALQLAEKDGYFALIDDTELDIGKSD